VKGESREAPPLASIAPAILVLAFGVMVPAYLLVRTSFSPGSTTEALPGWTFEQWVKFLGDPYYLYSVFETLVIAAATSLACLLLGAPVGYSIARLPPAKRRWRMILVILPLSLSLVVVVFGWLVLMGRTGLINNILVGLGLVDAPVRLLFNTPIVILVLVQQFLPYMILTVMSVCVQIDPVLEDAAASLRSNRLATIRRVILPLAFPGLAAGATLVFVLSAVAFVTPRMIGGTRVRMLGGLVYDQVLVILNWPFGAALATGLFVIVLGVLGLSNVLLATTTSRRVARHAS